MSALRGCDGRIVVFLVMPHGNTWVALATVYVHYIYETTETESETALVHLPASGCPVTVISNHIHFLTTPVYACAACALQFALLRSQD
jgi:hypothetical protein